MPKQPDLLVDSELATLCLPLTEEELGFLADSLKKEGCREPVIYWKIKNRELCDCPIVDGYHRYRLCRDLGIDHAARPMEFAGKREAEDWMIRNQLGRRNASEIQKANLRGKLYIQELATPPTVGSDAEVAPETPRRNVAKEVAGRTGVSERRIHQDKELTVWLDRLGQKSAKLRDAAIGKVIFAKDAKILADAPVEMLKPLAEVPDESLRAAARELAKTITEGRPKPSATHPVVRVKSLDDLQQVAAKLVRAKTEALQACGGRRVDWAFGHAESIRHHLNEIFDEILAWQREAEARDAG